MAQFPTTITEFNEWFTIEDDCRAYLFNIRWPNGFLCPFCGSAKGVWPARRGLYVCKDCRRDISPTAGTLFQDTHKSLKEWFEVIWYVTSLKTGVSALGLQKALGMGSYQTAWNWLQKLRRAMVRPDRDNLDGVVEVDETFIGGAKPGKHGHGAKDKSLVLIAAQKKDKGMGRIRLQKIQDASAPVIHEALLKMVAPGATVLTDSWPSYNSIPSIGYVHKVVREHWELGDNLLPSAHRVASLLKKWMLGTHQGAISAAHLEYYLDEFTFRFNRRTSKSRGLLFYRLVTQSVNLHPINGRSLIAA
jgi:transposase-like protein